MTDNDTLSPPPPAPPPPAPPLRPPLRRSRTQSMVGGISGGLAEHTGIDVLLFRVAFVVLTFAGGAGLLLYAALWLLLPDADGRRGPLRRWIDGRPSTSARNVVLLLVALLVLALVIEGSGFGGGVLALAAIAVLAYLWSRDRDVSPPVTVEAAAPYPAPTYPVTAVPPPVPPRERRPRSRLGAVTVSLLLVVLGGLAVADRGSDLDVSTAGYLGAALGVVGAGLLVGTFWGRSRGLIFLGIPIMAVLIPVSALGIDARDGVGERAWTPTGVTHLAAEYRYGVGHGQLDLRDVDFTSAGSSTTLTLNVGYAEVLLPPDVDVTVSVEVTSGEIELFERRYVGDDGARATATDDGLDGPGGGELELFVDVNLGYVEVTRVR